MDLWTKPSDAVMVGLKRLYDSGAESDFTIICAGKEFKVHKNILLMHSDALYKMSSRAGFTEALNSKATLDHDDLDLVTQMIYFMYHCTYSCPKQPSEYASFNIRMAIIADKYNIPHLVKLACTNFRHTSRGAEHSTFVAQAVAQISDSGSKLEAFKAYVAQKVLVMLPYRDPDSNSPEPTAIYTAHLNKVLIGNPKFTYDLLVAVTSGKGNPDPRLENVKYYMHCSDTVVIREVDAKEKSYFQCQLCGVAMSAGEWTKFECCPKVGLTYK